jgi:hypothetical protein
MTFQILLAFDSDEPGHKAMLRAGAKIERYTAAINAWHTGSWEAFDQLADDVQTDAWRFLTNQTSDRSAAIADAEGVAELPLYPVKRAQPKRTWVPHATHRGRKLDDIPTVDYVHALTGKDVDIRRPSCCPLPDHDDSTASFHAYENNSWVCYGCDRGGRIFDFAAALWGIGGALRGNTFRSLRDRLQEIFG